MWLFFPLRPVDLRSFFKHFFSVCCPEVGQTEPPPALAFSSVGRGVSAGQLISGQHTKNWCCIQLMFLWLEVKVEKKVMEA